MPVDSGVADVERAGRALQQALLLHPPDYPDAPVVLTVNPHCWGVEYRVINDGPLLGVGAHVVRVSEAVERGVVLGFHAAGWPTHRVVEGYREDLKSPVHLDVALLDEHGQPLVAVEVKRSFAHESARRIREGMRQLREVAPEVPWHCVTDGSTYHLRHNVTGQSHTLECAFSPAALVTGDFSVMDEEGNAPRSLDELDGRLRGARHVIIDQSIPLVRIDRLRALLEQALGQSLPSTADLGSVLLSFVAKVESVSWIGMFAPAALLRGEATQWVRSQVGSRFAVRAVIEGEGIAPDVHHLVRVCVVHFSREQGLAFLASISGADPVKALEEHTASGMQFLAGNKPKTGFVAQVDSSGRWAVSLYDPELDQLEARLAGIGPTQPLSSLCTIIRGVSVTLQTASTNDGVPIVTRLSQVADPLSIPEDARRIVPTPENERYLLRQGDAIVPSLRGGTLQCVLMASDASLVAGDRLFILRINDPLLTPEFLVEYLNSRLAQRLLEERYAGSAGHILTPRSLGNLPVPMLGRSVTLDLREIGALAGTLRSRAEELDLQRQSLFDATSAQGLATAIAELRHKGEALSRSLARANDLTFQVANFYPFPIAYGYRLLASITHPMDLYKEQLRVGENILAFVASVAMSLIQPNDRPSLGLDVAAVWDGGASPGHWKDIIGKSCKVLSTYRDHPLAASIVGLHITTEKKGFGAAVAHLIKAKNDFKHDRGPRTEEEYLTATREIQQILDTCIKALAFFTDHPIRQVIDLDLTRSGEMKLRCLALVGDHPGLPQEEITYRTPLTKRDLYIEAAGIGWVSLFPLLVARNCTACKTRETFFLDKWNRKNGTAARKSFERGHEEQTSEVLDHMKAWLDAAPKP